MDIQREGHKLTVILRDDPSASLKQRVLECPIDINKLGEPMGIEIEGPCYIFGQAVLVDLPIVQLTSSKKKLTPKGRHLAAHAQSRPPKPIAPLQITYDASTDMMYIYLAPTSSRSSPYEISIPVDCTFHVDQVGRLYRLDIPLDQLRKTGDTPSAND